MADPFPCRLFAVVVVYNKSISESTTIKRLLRVDIRELEIIVADNSTLDYNNEQECREKSIHYISMCGNKGLSKAYNAALSYIQGRSGDDDLVIWFDDDTQITKEYFLALRDSLIRNRGSEVFAPIIYGQDGKIYSPNNAGFLKNKLLKSIDDEIDYHRFNAINSCLAVRQRIYRKYRYNEDLFLDSIDQRFFDDLRKSGAKFSILYTPVVHNFSQREKSIDTIRMAQRLRIRVKDLMTYGRKGMRFTLLAVVKACGWGIVFSWRCRSISLLGICVTHSILGFLNNIKYFLGIAGEKMNRYSDACIKLRS